MRSADFSRMPRARLLSIAAAAAAGIGAYALFRGEEQRSQDFRAVDGALGGVLSKAGLGGKQQGELPAPVLLSGRDGP